MNSSRDASKGDVLESKLEEIDPASCLELLRREQLGRICVVDRGRPEIFPVNYALDASDSVIFKTVVGTKLHAAINCHVAFEIDGIDSSHMTGWSVVVHGVAHQTDRIVQGEQDLAAWHVDFPYMVRISQTSISGRKTHIYPTKRRKSANERVSP